MSVPRRFLGVATVATWHFARKKQPHPETTHTRFHNSLYSNGFPTADPARSHLSLCGGIGLAAAATLEARIMASISRDILSLLGLPEDAQVHPLLAEEPIHQSCVRVKGGVYWSISRVNVAN